MNDRMNELVQFSPHAGELVLEKVAGEISKKIEFENEVQAASGRERTLYCRPPVSGCPDPKQTQVLMVLRDGQDEASARSVMASLQLDRLSEEEHFILLFPNPTDDGWNFRNEPGRESDTDFLVRCFDAIRTGTSRVSGFNGMIFYLATSPQTSAMLMTTAALKPANVSAMMVSALPADYSLPEGALNVEVAAWSSDPAATEYLKRANGVDEASGVAIVGKSADAADGKTAEAPDGISGEATDRETVEAPDAMPSEAPDGITLHLGRNPNVRLLTTTRPTDADTVRIAWDRLFASSRRWQNDTHGTYQHRTAFTARGFVPHVKDTRLGVNGGRPHTWYEYVPPQLRGTEEKAPLVFYFHGGNCVPLYGAEQSGLHDLADREGFIVVFPEAAKSKCWNIWNESRLPSDFDFVLALIGHMKTVHPIDESRIYLSGFSMGGMMTHALAGAFPERFAAGAPCNAFNMGYLKDPASLLVPFQPGTKAEDFENVSYARLMADAKKAEKDYRMPIFQNAGYDDGTICLWPVDAATKDARTETIRLWKAYNGIPDGEGSETDVPVGAPSAAAPAGSPADAADTGSPSDVDTRAGRVLDPTTPTGLAADETFWRDEEKRFVHQRWHSSDEGNPSLLELVVARRMPHAILPVQLEWAWAFMRRFSRAADGRLVID